MGELERVAVMRAWSRTECICAAILFVGALHIAQQCLAGFVQCAALGCLPNDFPNSSLTATLPRGAEDSHHAGRPWGERLPPLSIIQE